MATNITLTNGNDIWSGLVELPGATEGVDLSALAGNDSIVGTSFADIMNGNEDNDIMDGGDGADTLYGGKGNDTLSGGLGANYINGNIGDDRIVIVSTNNLVYGGKGNDTILAESAENEIYGNIGDDYIVIGAGAAFVSANEGNDTIESGEGNDSLYGGKGDDFIDASEGDNFTNGNIGDDTITVGTGLNIAHGGQGDDRIILIGNPTAPVQLIGDLGSNTIEIQGATDLSNVRIFGARLGDTQLVEGSSNTLISQGMVNLDTVQTLSLIQTLDINEGSVLKVNAQQLGSSGVVEVKGSGLFQPIGTQQQITDLISNPDIEISGVTTVPIIINPDNSFKNIDISREEFGLASTVTSFFVIDGSQFATLIPPGSEGALQKSLGALALQFGVITTNEAAQINQNPNNIPAAVANKIINFGDQLNNAQYIPQVTLAQSDSLLDGFYDLISNNGIEPVDNRFFSVIDTKGTTATTDDITTLYYSSNGQFELDTSQAIFTSEAGQSLFTASNPPLTPVTLASIAPSTQILSVA